jgi:hypothetical protein
MFVTCPCVRFLYVVSCFVLAVLTGTSLNVTALNVTVVTVVGTVELDI